MSKDSKAYETLPDGRNVMVTLAQARRVWQVWLALAPIAASRGEGVGLERAGDDPDGEYPHEGDDDDIKILTIYSRQNECVKVVCAPDGSAKWENERDAPSVQVDLAAPPPLGPWEKMTCKCNLCAARRVAAPGEECGAIRPHPSDLFLMMLRGMQAFGAQVGPRPDLPEPRTITCWGRMAPA